MTVAAITLACDGVDCDALFTGTDDLATTRSQARAEGWHFWSANGRRKDECPACWRVTCGYVVGGAA